MTTSSDLPAGRLRCLAVRSTVVMPRSVATLDLQRRENLLALDSHPEGDEPLVAVPLIDLEGEAAPHKLARIGTLCRVLDRTRLPDGSQRVVLQGLRRVVLSAVDAEQGYLAASVADPAVGSYDDRQLRERVERAMQLATELVRLDSRYSSELPRVLALNTSAAGHFADLAASRLHLSYADRTRLLVETDVAQRLDILIELLGADVTRGELTQALQSKVQERVRRGFLREQLQVIQGELGELDGIEAQVRDLAERVEHAPLPVAARRACSRELVHLRRASSGSEEAARIRNWVEWLLELPWTEVTHDPTAGGDDYTKVVTALDLTHTGLDDVKERVSEFLAVRHLAGSARGTVLCFLGPSGTGKTSMARAVADALGRRFVHIHVGSCADEGELRGRHLSHAGAGAGRLMQGIARAGVRNPVVLLDELDKIHTRGWSQASSALLEILDPEQNREFVDHYLGVPFDLSECIFLVTANDIEPIPDALLDRLEVIPFGSYTESEKLAIAREHLLPRARLAAGLSPKDLQLSPGALVAIVRSYTAEPGVRQLQRNIDALARKAAVQRVREEHGLRVDKQQLSGLLGPANLDPFVHAAEPRIGVVAGLAWTSAGGSILPIETLLMKGAGRTTLTGSIGEVMRESVQTALSWVRMQLPRLGLEPELLESIDLHLHFPAGGTPKDGPSAGIAIATSLISVLTRTAVRHDVAMTGEISLHGAVLPVGGLREKLLAALRAGVKTAIVPARNSEEVLRLPREIRRRLEIKLVDHVSEALGWSLLTRRPGADAAPAAPAVGPRNPKRAARAEARAPRRRRRSG
ncbi:MAG: endopeptidase La [Planctomycetes bacterium]|nr:endopeptidase La [Planctomycetota bacterium]